jgi:tRNA threonylcarbamoyladenosine biosynthesis protein TsaE
MVVSLVGKLGVGKTTFVKGIAEALGIEEQVTSPSFTIMSVYRAPITLYHIDLYRIDDTAEIVDAGIEDVLYNYKDGVAVIEWGEQADAILPEDFIQVNFTLAKEGSRSISVRGIQF